jgi:hypothetical protein
MKTNKLAAAFPRLSWGRSPIQKAHSTPKGERGYSRDKSKRELRKLVRDFSIIGAAGLTLQV